MCALFTIVQEPETEETEVHASPLTSAMTSARAELHSSSQRRGVMPFVLF